MANRPATPRRRPAAIEQARTLAIAADAVRSAAQAVKDCTDAMLAMRRAQRKRPRVKVAGFRA